MDGREQRMIGGNILYIQQVIRFSFLKDHSSLGIIFYKANGSIQALDEKNMAMVRCDRPL